MIVTTPHTFKDGRVGTFTRSDKIYKVTTEKVFVEIDGKIVERTVPKNIYYEIKKKGTDEHFDDAIDLVPCEYEEVSLEEMEAKYGSNK